jgi:hypothetical protein
MKKLSVKNLDTLFWVVIGLVALSGGMLLMTLFAGNMAIEHVTTVPWGAWFLAALAAVLAIVWKRNPKHRATPPAVSAPLVTDVPFEEDRLH